MIATAAAVINVILVKGSLAGLGRFKGDCPRARPPFRELAKDLDATNDQKGSQELRGDERTQRLSCVIREFTPIDYATRSNFPRS